MPRYRCVRETYICHLNQKVQPGEIFETVFPKLPDGSEMRLSSNLELLPDEDDDKPKAKGKGHSPKVDADLV